MHCPENVPCPADAPEWATGEIAALFAGTFERNTPWKLYNHLIAGMPAEPVVTDYCLGTHWSYVEATCGMGVAFTASGGAKRRIARDLRGLPLRDVANLAKSWCFEEATLGIAAMNAWYARHELLDPMGARYDEVIEREDGTIRKIDAFEIYRPRVAACKDGNANVTVIGHFPHVDRITEYANLTVLERKCTDALDTPDPGCEYVLPQTDFAFITGVTLINKTAPRLLDLCKDNGVTTVMTGPSVVPSPHLFKWGVEMMAGSVVADPEKTAFAVKNGKGQFFGEALQMMSVTRP